VRHRTDLVQPFEASWSPLEEDVMDIDKKITAERREGAA
jgi:hypothetical protein